MKRLILLIAIILFASTVEATTYTVCSSGCDHTTIQAAFDGHDLTGDDIVEVRADTPGGSKSYTEMVTWGSNDGGTSGHPVILRARAGDTITITGSAVRDNAILSDVSYITIDGFTITGTVKQGIRVWGTGITVTNCIVYDCGIPDNYWWSDGILFDNGTTASTISHNTIYSNGTHGAYVLNSDTVTIEYNTFYENVHTNLDIQQSISGTSDGHIVRYNYFYRPSGSTTNYALSYAEGATGTVTNLSIYYNIFADYSASTADVQGVQLEGVVTPVVVYNNAFYNMENYCLYLNNGTGTVTIKNNICQNTGGSNHRILMVSSATNKTINYNDWNWSSDTAFVVGGTPYSDWATYKSGTGFDANSTNGDPLFVNTAGADFMLRAGSPAIDTGDNVSLTTDYRGASVPRGSGYDMGAYEFIGGTISNKQCYLYSSGGFQ